MIRAALVTSCLVASASAQAMYDFNQLSGSDIPPYTLLHGQDNWSEQTYNAANRCGVTATLSFDGTPALRFQEAGPGYGCDASRINDAAWSFPPFRPGAINAYFQADLLIGHWGGSFGLAFDTNGNGMVRGSEPRERGPRFNVGGQANAQFQLIAADDTVTRVPLANAGVVAGNWVRIRVVMDLPAAGGAGLGSVDVMNLTGGATTFTPVVGLQNIPLGLNPNSVDATNPSLWNALWLHFEGATYSLDNVQVGRAGFGRPYGTACSGAFGPATLTAQGAFGGGQTVQFVSTNHAASVPGVIWFGASNSSHGGVPLPFLLDPLLGTSGCSLHASVDVSLAAVTSNTAPATLTLPFTLPPSTFAARVYMQHACLEAVPGGLSFSNGLLVQLP